MSIKFQAAYSIYADEHTVEAVSSTGERALIAVFKSQASAKELAAFFNAQASAGLVDRHVPASSETCAV